MIVHLTNLSKISEESVQYNAALDYRSYHEFIKREAFLIRLQELSSVHQEGRFPH